MIRGEVAQVQPLRREVVDERTRPGVREHAAHLPFEHERFVQLSGNRHVQQLIVRDAAPEEKGQARRELEIADAIWRIGRNPWRIGLDAKEEIRTHQHARHGHLDAGFEPALDAALLIESHRPAQITLGDRTTVRALQQR